MQVFSSALLVLVALTGYAAAINQIKCFSCTSETDPNCNDPLNTEHGLVAKECTNDLTNNILGGLNTGLKGIGSIFGLEKTPQIDATFVCIKGAYTSKSQDGSEKKMVVRSCGVAGSKICESLNQKSKEGGISDVFCEECNTDGCNGSSAIHAAAFLLIPALALLLRSH